MNNNNKPSLKFLLERACAFYVGEFDNHFNVEIQRRIHLGNPKHDKVWAIVGEGSVYNRLGEWEFEPQPSSRDEEFFSRCRYTIEEAMTVVGWRR